MVRGKTAKGKRVDRFIWYAHDQYRAAVFDEMQAVVDDACLMSNSFDTDVSRRLCVFLCNEMQ